MVWTDIFVTRAVLSNTEVIVTPVA